MQITIHERRDQEEHIRARGMIKESVFRAPILLRGDDHLDSRVFNSR